MSWGLAILLIIIFVALSALFFLNVDNAWEYADVYLIVILVILFIILLFAVDFSNPISTTVTINTSKKQSPLIYDIPYNADSSYSNLFTAVFTGTWSDSTDPVNTNINNVTFNYDTITEPVKVLGNTSKITITKLPNYQIQVDIDPTVDTEHKIDGFLNITLLCTSAQSINSRFNLD